MTLSPKRLSTKEMWTLYGFLKSGMDGRKQEPYLIDEIYQLLERINQENYLKSLSLLYNDRIEYAKLLPVDSVSLLVDGLKKNNFFEFSGFARELSNK